MERKIYQKLVEWKSNEQHKPLILNGVRQCEKTFILKEFGKKEFKSLAYISCDRNEELDAVFEGGFNVAKIIRGISALTGVDITPGKTLIFLDEIQVFPKALESLKYFCTDAFEQHRCRFSIRGLAVQAFHVSQGRVSFGVTLLYSLFVVL